MSIDRSLLSPSVEHFSKVDDPKVVLIHQHVLVVADLGLLAREVAVSIETTISVDASLGVLVLVELQLVVLHLGGEVRLSLVLLALLGAAASFALEEGLVVDARSYLVRLDVVLHHFLVELAKFIDLLAVATADKESTVDELDVAHWFCL